MAGLGLTTASRQACATAFGLAAAAFMGAGPALAADFTQDECKGIALSANEVVRTAGAQTLSREFHELDGA